MDSEQARQETAKFRFGVIAPLVVRELEPGERSHILRDLAHRFWKLDDGRVIRIHRRTIARWAARYKAHGYAGLLPEVRVDSGKRRALSEAVVARAVALRQEDTERSVRASSASSSWRGWPRRARSGAPRSTTRSVARASAGPR